MSNISIICIQLIILISNIIFLTRTIAASSCEFSSAIHLQSATYIHPLILRIQPIDSSNKNFSQNKPSQIRVRVREILKSSYKQTQVKMNDMIIIKITNDDDDDDSNQFLDDTCWNLLRLTNIDSIIFLNETNTNQFDLHYPPVESTLRVRQNIDTVLRHETYSPQVLIKTRLDNPIVSKDYSLQCNSRGNPLPRLYWSKKSDQNQIIEYYPLSKQCQTKCRIYSIQNKYQSILYFHSLNLKDSGIYTCHAENPMNRTITSVHLNIDENHTHLLNRTVTCASLKYCHNRGQCLTIENQLKCLCDNRYFGDQCETNYDDIIKKQDSAILLFKSRFLAGCILVFIGLLLVLIALLSWFLARYNREQRKKFRTRLPGKMSPEKPLISPVKEVLSSIQNKTTIPSSPAIEKPSNSLSTPLPSPPPPPPPPIPPRSPLPSTTIHISQSPIIEKKANQSRFSRRTITREPSTATDDDDDDGLSNFLRLHQTLPPVPTKIDEEYEERFSLNMNKSEELGLGCLTNGIHSHEPIFSHNYVELHPTDNQTGLIKPLTVQNESPQRYTKYVSSYSKFVLPRPIHSSSSTSNYPQ